MKQYISKFIFAFSMFFVIFIIFVPYFTNDFLDLRQRKENEENYQKFLKEQEAIKKKQKEAEEKIYLMGKFDPARRTDFALVPEEYNIAGYKIYLQKETLSAFLKMEQAAEIDGINLKITSGTRNFDYQKDLWNKKWTGVSLVEGKDLSKSLTNEEERFEKILEYSAVPGTSRHHWGTEVDINSVTPKFFETEKGKEVYNWLVENAATYGFCQTYNLRDITRPSGYKEEKWHWSYLPLSKNLMQEYKNLIKYEDIKGFLGDEYVSNFNLIKNYVLAVNPDCL